MKFQNPNLNLKQVFDIDSIMFSMNIIAKGDNSKKI